MKFPIAPTWQKTRRSFWRRTQWGLALGGASIFDGLVDVLSLGQFGSNLAMQVAVKMTVAEHRRLNPAKPTAVVSLED